MGVVYNMLMPGLKNPWPMAMDVNAPTTAATGCPRVRIGRAAPKGLTVTCEITEPMLR